MKKFLAVLLAVALLGVAGAAFADTNAGHTEAGHNTKPSDTTGYVIDSTALTKAALGLVKGVSSSDVQALLGSNGTVEEVNSSDVVAAYAKKNYVVACYAPKLVVNKDIASLTIPMTFDSAYAGKTIQSDLNDVASAAVLLAAASSHFETTAGTTTTTVPASSPYTVNLVIAGLQAGHTYQPVALIKAVDVADLSQFADAVKKDTSGDPTSNKGSGGCNAGFAGLAVLALGLVALRRKAR